MNRALQVFIPVLLLSLCPSKAVALGFPAHDMVADTLIATATGSTTPPIDPNGDPVINGDFTITRSGGDDRVGNGIDDRTEWRLTNTPDYDSTDLVVSPLLTLTEVR